MLSMKPIYPKEIFIVGAGSAGVFLTARLEAQNPVRLVTYDDRVPLFSKGIRLCLHTEKGYQSQEYHSFSCIGWSKIEKFPRECFVIIATKTFHFPTVLPEIIKRTDGSQTIVLCQNGLGILEYVERLLGKESQNPNQWIRMASWFGPWLKFEDKPVVYVSGVRGVELAQKNLATNSFAIKELADVFIKSDIPASILENHLYLEWRKVLINIFINGVCTITNSLNKTVLEDPFLLQIANRLLTEVMLVAKAEGIELGEKDREHVYKITKIVGENFNSTLQDLRAGQTTEMPWLSGAVVDRGKKYGIPTPSNLMVYELIESLDRQKAFLKI